MSPREAAKVLEEAERDHPVRSGGHPDAYARGLADLVSVLEAHAGASRSCHHPSIVNTSAGPFCEECGAEV